MAGQSQLKKPETVKFGTSFGIWTMVLRSGVVQELRFPKHPPKIEKFTLGKKIPKEAAGVARFLQGYFVRQRVRTISFDCHPSEATPFQKRVWRQLRRIPLGQTRSYQSIACSLGLKKGARAVGNACGSNPLPLWVPCHRVIAHDGGMGGFSAGLAWKKWLLKFEALACKKDGSHVNKRK